MQNMREHERRPHEKSFVKVAAQFPEFLLAQLAQVHNRQIVMMQLGNLIFRHARFIDFVRGRAGIDRKEMHLHHIRVQLDDKIDRVFNLLCRFVRVADNNQRVRRNSQTAGFVKRFVADFPPIFLARIFIQQLQNPLIRRFHAKPNQNAPGVFHRFHQLRRHFVHSGMTNPTHLNVPRADFIA